MNLEKPVSPPKVIVGTLSLFQYLDSTGLTYSHEIVESTNNEEVIQVVVQGKRGGLFSFRKYEGFYGAVLMVNVHDNWVKEDFSKEEISNKSPCWKEFFYPENFCKYLCGASLDSILNEFQSKLALDELVEEVLSEQDNSKI